MSAPSRKITIWLLHGTWARHARWTQEGSPLRKTLESELEGEVRFECFPWSGRNRSLDRRQAAAQLLERIKADSAHGQATFIVAHSHGGNIAADAVALNAYRAWRDDEEVAPLAIDGIVTLNTPFVSFLPREVALIGVSQLLLLVSFLFLPFYFLPVSPVVALSISLTLIAVVVGSAVFTFKRNEGAAREALRVVPDNEPHGIRRTKTLVCHTADDEATGWLEAVDNILNLPFLVLHPLALALTFVALAAIHYTFRWQFMFITWMAASVEQGTDPPSLSKMWLLPPPYVSPEMMQVATRALYDGEAPLWLFGSVFLSSVFGHFLLYWALLLVTALLVTLLVRAIAFGEGMGMLALLKAMALRLKVTLVPLTLCDAELSLVQQSHGWVRHSDIHEGGLELNRIARWMNQRLDERRARQSNVAPT